MSVKPIAFTKFSFDNLTIPPLQSREGGGLFAKPQYTYASGMTGELQLQLPVSTSPYGFSDFQDKKDPNKHATSMSINFEMGGAFHKWASEYLENELVNYAHKHTKSIFNKDHSKEVVRALSNGVVRVPQDPEKAKTYPHTFKASIKEKKRKEGDKMVSFEPKQYQSVCVDKNGRPMDITHVGRNALVRLIVKLTNFYVISGKFGLSWELVKCVVMHSGENADVEDDPDMYPGEECYKPLEEVYNDDMELAIQKAEEEAVQKRERSEEPQEPEEEPEPQPKKAKKKASEKKK